MFSAGEAIFGEDRDARFQDVDAAGIVFFPRILEYFSDVYISFLTARGMHVARSIERSNYRIPLVHAEADYFAPMRFGDRVRVEVVALHLGRTSFQVGYRIKHADGRVAAVGHTAHVTVDLADFKPIALPEELRAALAGGMA